MSYTPQKTRGSFAKDVFTLPNAITTAGYWLVCDGCRDITALHGAAKIAAGRTLDIVDGRVARRFGQESNVGALIDASCDKLGLLHILQAAWKHQAAPKSVIGTLAALHAVNAAASTVASVRHPEASYRPPQSGKFAMALGNVAIICNIAASAAERHAGAPSRLSNTLNHVGAAAFIASLPLSAHAAHCYIKRARAASEDTPQS